jgi:hypothetical protein
MVKFVFKDAHSFRHRPPEGEPDLTPEELARKLHAYLSRLRALVLEGRPPRELQMFMDANTSHPVAGLHREGAPAVTRPDGRAEWHREGKIHRGHGPAMVAPRGEQEWWEEGRRR